MSRYIKFSLLTIFALFFVVGLPKTAGATGFGKLTAGVVVHYADGSYESLGGTKITAFSSKNNDSKWATSAGVCYGCRTGSVVLNGSPYDSYPNTAVASITTGTSTNWGYPFDPKYQFSCGASSCLSSTDLGGCNPFNVTAVYPGNGYFFGYYQGFSDPGFVSTRTNIAANYANLAVKATINNDSRTYVRFDFRQNSIKAWNNLPLNGAQYSSTDKIQFSGYATQTPLNNYRLRVMYRRVHDINGNDVADVWHSFGTIEKTVPGVADHSCDTYPGNTLYCSKPNNVISADATTYVDANGYSGWKANNVKAFMPERLASDIVAETGGTGEYEWAAQVIQDTTQQSWAPLWTFKIGNAPASKSSLSCTAVTPATGEAPLSAKITFVSLASDGVTSVGATVGTGESVNGGPISVINALLDPNEITIPGRTSPFVYTYGSAGTYTPGVRRDDVAGDDGVLGHWRRCTGSSVTVVNPSDPNGGEKPPTN